MNIFIDNGKTHIFTQRLIPHWKNLNHNIVSDFKKANIHLSFIEFKTKTNLPKVLRLDGLFLNDKSHISKVRKSTQIACKVVYQSSFCKKVCQQYLQVPENKNTIIYNGIEPNWCSSYIPHKEFNIVVLASWRRWKRLKEILNIFEKFVVKHPNSFLHVIGNPDIQRNIINVKYHGQRNQEQIKALLQKMDLGIYIAKKDWCPNAFLEIVGAGIPIITTDACGGATEMSRLIEGCIILSGEEKEEKIDYYKESFNILPNIIEQKLLKALHEKYFKRDRVKLPEILQISHVSKQYLEVLQSCLF